MTRCNLWPLALLALLALCGELHAQNATGEPTVTAGGVVVTAAPAEDAELIAAKGNIADPNTLPSPFTPSWAWHEGDAADGDFTAIAGATAAAFTPLQAHVGKFLRVCANFRDAVDNQESRCWTSVAAVANVDDAAVAKPNTIFVPAGGSYTFSADDFPFTDEDDDDLSSVRFLTAPANATGSITSTSLGVLQSDGQFELTRGVTVVGRTIANISLADIGTVKYFPRSSDMPMASYTTFTWTANNAGTAATITIDLVAATQAAATGAPTVTAASGTAYNEDVELTAAIGTVADTNGIPAGGRTWQWQSAAAPASGTPADGDYTAIAGATADKFTPLQAHVGRFIRVCLSFMDGRGNAEGPLCSAPAAGNAIAAVNDVPTSGDSSVNVPPTATADAPYTFKIGDFPFMDEETASLASITIVETIASGKGTLRDGSTAVTDSTTVMAANLSGLTYYPPANTTPAANFASFRFTVSDGTASSAMHTMTINIVSPMQVAATGQPAIVGTPRQGRLAAIGRGTLSDENGIDFSTLSYQWQSAATADGTFADIEGATADTFAPMQAHVGMHLRVCVEFMDLHSDRNEEGPLCSDAAGPVANVNDKPVAQDGTEYTARNMPGSTDTFIIHPAAFQAAYTDPDGDFDMLAAVNITTPPPAADGILSFGGTPVTATAMAPQTLTINGDEFMGGPLTFTPASRDTESTDIGFTLTDSGTPAETSDTATITINIQLGQDITEQQAVQISAILSVAAATNAADAIMAGMSAGPNDLSLGGTSLAGTARTLRQSAAAEQNPWYHSTTAEWEYNAAYNASDNSAETLRSRLQSMAAGDIALSYSLTDMSTMRFWARYQSIDISGNEGEMMEYDGSGSGFYIGADNQITDTLRIGLAIGTDSADISIDLDDDKTNAADEATRSATTVYPYMQMDLGNNNQARVIAGFGSGTLDIKSSANSNETASADLSWNMLAASIRHHRPMKGNLSARFDGSLQLGNTSTDETTFTSGSTLMAADSSTNEIAIDAQLRYRSNSITPFASITARKQGGDLSQALAMDLGLGADLQTNPANLRLAITRQINDTTHQRHSISIDASTNPNPSGITASLGSRYDTITGKPQWRTTISWQRHRFQTSLQANPGDYRLQARLRW